MDGGRIVESTVDTLSGCAVQLYVSVTERYARWCRGRIGYLSMRGRVRMRRGELGKTVSRLRFVASCLINILILIIARRSTRSRTWSGAEMLLHAMSSIPDESGISVPHVPYMCRAAARSSSSKLFHLRFARPTRYPTAYSTPGRGTTTVIRQSLS